MSDSVDTLKQRVVGAFVIISLAVIFLPMIFDEPHEQHSNVIVPVPPRPTFKVVEIEKPVKPEFQRLEFDQDLNKVVVQESAVSAIDVPAIDVHDDENNVAKIDQGSKTASSESKTPEPPVKPRSENLISKPSVSHLPIFKNVWMVQLGTFSQVDNAYQLRDRLRLDGFDGHTKKVDLNGSTAIRVFTGPFVDKAQAEKIKIKLDKKYKVESRVIFFDA